MLKSTLGLLIVICSILFLGACQKELFYDGVSQPRYDSLTLVHSVISINYDVDDQFLWKSEELYTYDEQAKKTLVLIKDSTANGSETYTETFSYDANKRLVSFENTRTAGYFSRLDFVYASNGDLQKAIYSLRDGRKLENHFQHASVNNNKVVTMFDTGMIGGRHTYYRPQLIKYTFNASNQLLGQVDMKTGPHKLQSNWYRDTFDYKFGYTPDDNLDRMTMEYTFVSNGINTPHVRDSVAFIRQAKSSALYDSYNYIYKNLYWFSFSEYTNNSFANSMVHNSFYPHYVYYFKQPLLTIEYHSSVYPKVYHSVAKGLFQNDYDEEGRLVKSVYPKYFANQAWGKQLIEYDYIKLRK